MPRQKAYPPDLVITQGGGTTMVESKLAPTKPKLRWGAWPPLDPNIVGAITRMLITNEKIFRPPRQAAKLLAYIVWLHHQKKPFPPRAEVSRLLSISIPTIDAALSSRLAEGYLRVEVDVIEGNIERRPSSLRQRFFVPSKELVETVEQATDNLSK